MSAEEQALSQKAAARRLAATRSNNLLPGFAGIALADILANGVAMVIILIVVTIAVRSAVEEQQLENAQDVTVLLSRELASSVVMNAIPTSPPAVLHDYKQAAFDRVPQHHRMPVLELYKEGVRHYYTQRVWSRNELLLMENGLDAYLQSLDKDQRRMVRVDIYSIKNFYLLMSILKAHDIKIRHWHFYGEKERGERPDIVFGGEGDQIADASTPKQGKEEAKGKKAAKKSADNLPEDAELSMSDISSMLYAGVDFSDSHEAGGKPGGKGQKGKSGAPQQFQLMLPKNAQQQASPMDFQGQLNMFDFLAFLYAFMEQAQIQADDGHYAVLAETHIEAMLGHYLREPPSLSAERKAFVQQVHKRLTALEGDDTIVIDFHEVVDQHGRVNVETNQNLLWVNLFANNTELHDTLLKVEVDVNLYPTVFQGMRMPLSSGGMVLISPEQLKDKRAKWRVVTITNQNFSHWLVGFVYAEVGENNALLLPAEVNRLTLDKQPVLDYFASSYLRNERALVLMYGSLAVFILLMIFRRFKQ